MTKTFSLAALLCVVFAIPTQAQKVTWGALCTDDINVHHRQIISTNPNNILVLRNDLTADVRAFNDYGTFKVDSYDKTFKQTLSVEMKPKLGNDVLRTEFGLDLKGNLYIVSSNGVQKEKRCDYYFQKLDRKTLQLQGAPVKFGEGNHNQFVDPSYCAFTPAPDSTRVLVVTMTNNKDFANAFGVYVLDKDMKVETSKRITLPIPGEKCSFMSSYLDAKGNAYLEVMNGSGDSKSANENAREVYCIKHKTAEVTKLPIKPQSGVLTDVNLSEGAGNSLVVTGLYSNSDPEVANGYVYARFNSETLAPEATMSKAFPGDFVAQSMKENQQDKAKALGGLDSYYLHSVYPMANGKTLILAERSFDKSSSQGTSIYFINLEIAAIMVDEKGDYLWGKKIPKRQIAKDVSWYSSFASTGNQDKVHLIYNDAPENLDKGLEEATAKYENAKENGVVAVATIGVDGSITRKVLFSNAELKTLTMPSFAMGTNSNQIIMCAKEFKRYFYGMVAF